MDQELIFSALTAPLAGSILDDVIEKTENYIQKKLESEHTSQKSIFVVGSRSSGKTSFIIDVFGLKDEELKPTLALDFFCAFDELSNDGYHEKMCNIWELPRGTNYGSVLMTIKAPKHLAAVIMLDLSSPNTLLHTATTSLDIIKNYIGNKYKDQSKLRALPNIETDIHMVEPLPIPVFFVGGKYDLFQEFEPEKKRVICQFLRYLAHINHGFLFFYSNKCSNLSKAAKNILSNYAFDVPLECQEKFEYNEPLLIPPGADSIEKIEGKGELDVQPTMEKYTDLLNSLFKQDDQVEIAFPNNPRFDFNYKEANIDCLRKQKDEAMDKFIETLEMNLRVNHREEDAEQLRLIRKHLNKKNSHK